MALASLAACGQKGDLFLPTDPAAANRATLPQVLIPGRTITPTMTDPSMTSPAPPAQTREPVGGQGTGTAAPVR
jgi:predicted small lipoprotein YifL